MTNDLSKGVLVGIILSAVFFAVKISKVKITSLSADRANKKVYHVSGQLFFASVSDFVNSFDFKEPNVSEIDLDLTQAHLWDDSAVGAIDKIVTKYQQNGIKVNLIGLNHESGKLIHQLSVHQKKDELVKIVNKIG